MVLGPGVPPTRGRGVFPVTALMSHGCVSNARYIMMVDNRDEGNIKVEPLSFFIQSYYHRKLSKSYISCDNHQFSFIKY